MIEFLRSGGPVMIPLGLCSLLALAIAIEKLINLRPSKILRPELADTLLHLIKRGGEEEARELLMKSPSILSRILSAAVENINSSSDEIRQSVLDAGRQQIPHLERYLPALGTIAGISPLLGLLGTVTGMIKVFTAISSQEVGLTAGLASGISEALITTATGLSLAIPALVLHQFFHARSDRTLLALEGIAMSFVRRLLEMRGEGKELREGAERTASASQGGQRP